MAYTINLDGESISEEELDLLRIKQSILEKLRVRFGGTAGNPRWPGPPPPAPGPVNISRPRPEGP